MPVYSFVQMLKLIGRAEISDMWVINDHLVTERKEYPGYHFFLLEHAYSIRMAVLRKREQLKIKNDSRKGP